MKKILFGITSLTLGGAERVLVDLTNKLSKEYDITIFTIYDKGELKKQLDSKITVISLYDKSYSEYNKFEKIKISLNLMFKKVDLNGYDVEIAFLEGPITRLFSKQKNVKKIAWIHNDISKVFGNGIKAKIKKWLDKRIYQRYDKIIFVSNENREDFNKVYGKLSKDKKSPKQDIVRNYLDYNKVVEMSKEEVKLPYNKSDINIVSVCRLVEQKAIDRFINIHARLEKDGIHSKVYIVGDGPLRYNLQKQIDRLGETQNFYLLGPKENPYPYIKNADYFCLLSYYEGYGMVLEEAKILNKPIIITDTAARESTYDYKKAIILENTESKIYEGLKELISSDHIKYEEKEAKDNIINTNIYEEILEKVKKIINI